MQLLINEKEKGQTAENSKIKRIVGTNQEVLIKINNEEEEQNDTNNAN